MATNKKRGIQFEFKEVTGVPQILCALAGIKTDDGQIRKCVVNRGRQTAEYDAQKETATIKWFNLYVWAEDHVEAVPDEFFDEEKGLEYLGFQLDPEELVNRQVRQELASIELI